MCASYDRIGSKSGMITHTQMNLAKIGTLKLKLSASKKLAKLGSSSEPLEPPLVHGPETGPIKSQKFTEGH